jgi:hypothetical protein
MPSTEPTLSTHSSGSSGSAAQPSAKQSDPAAVVVSEKSSPQSGSASGVQGDGKGGDKGGGKGDVKRDSKSGPRRFPSAVQTMHFKAFWVKPVEGKTSDDLVQTVIPKRLLKKAVDRNGLRRVLRESVRARLGVKLAPISSSIPTPRVVLTSAKGFAAQPSRHALKGAWREELDRLMALLLLRLKA